MRTMELMMKLQAEIVTDEGTVDVGPLPFLYFRTDTSARHYAGWTENEVRFKLEEIALFLRRDTDERASFISALTAAIESAEGAHAAP